LTNIKQWKSLTSQLGKVLTDLPTFKEREEIISSLKNLINVLGELNTAIGMLPTAEEAFKAKEALSKLESVINNNPLLRSQGPRRSLKTVSRKRINGMQPEHIYPIEQIEKTLERISRMPEGSIRSELINSKDIPNALLKAILTHLGRRTSEKSPRNELVEQLIVTIVNKRTYQGLRGE
jgi:hypothetical protein